MRRVLTILYVITLIFCLLGCDNTTADFIEPVDVFYCVSPITYDTIDGVFGREAREFFGWEGNLHDFLNDYLTGPKNSRLVSPFPLGGRVLDFKQNESTIKLVLNVHFSRLAPNELTLACACISMTLFELTNAESVDMQIDGVGEENLTIIMTRSNLHLSDTTKHK